MRRLQGPFAELLRVTLASFRKLYDLLSDRRTGMLRLDQLAPTMGVESWIIMAGGAFLLSLCFLVSFIAADAWMSRQPISLRSICSSVLELYESRGEITDNEKWQQELTRLRNDCAVALSTKYSPTGTR